MKNRLMKMVAACVNAGGEPDLYYTLLEASATDIAEGRHYDLLTTAAEQDGYEGPFVCWDEDELPKSMDQLFDWDAVRQQMAEAQQRAIQKGRPVPDQQVSEEIAQEVGRTIRDVLTRNGRIRPGQHLDIQIPELNISSNEQPTQATPSHRLKFPSDKELAQLVLDAAHDEQIIDDQAAYKVFLKDLADLVADHFGGQRVGDPEIQDGEWRVPFARDESVPECGGELEKLDPRVKISEWFGL